MQEHSILKQSLKKNENYWKNTNLLLFYSYNYYLQIIQNLVYKVVL